MVGREMATEELVKEFLNLAYLPRRKSKDELSRYIYIIRGYTFPQNLVNDLLRSERADIIQTVMQEQYVPPEHYKKLSQHESLGIRSALCNKNDLPKEIILELLDCETKKEAVSITSSLLRPAPGDSWHPLVDEEVMMKMAVSPYLEVKKKLASKKNLPVSVIYKLFEDRDIQVRRSIVKQENLPKDLIAYFLEDDNPHIRKVLARKDLEPDQIERLLNDQDLYVRAAMATGCKKLSDDQLRQLYKDEEVYVRRCVARRGYDNLPEDIVQGIVKDPNDWIPMDFCSLAMSEKYLFQLSERNSFNIFKALFTSWQNSPRLTEPMLVNMGSQEPSVLLELIWNNMNEYFYLGDEEIQPDKTTLLHLILAHPNMTDKGRAQLVLTGHPRVVRIIKQGITAEQVEDMNWN